VQDVDRRAKQVVLSRRRLLEQQAEAAKKKLWKELEEGQVREGVVRNVVDYGAFIDLGGADGLLHISDMSYSRVDKPSDVVKEGDTVRVKVLKIDHEQEKVRLGLKQVEPDPWEAVADRLKPGDQVTGKVVRLAPFGAFVELEPGIEGLLPIAEMSWRRIGKPDEIVKQGDTVRLAVLQVDPAKHRLSLSLKQAQGDPWIGAERKYERNSVVEAKVVRTTDFGAFAELEPGVEGLVHISELSDRRVRSVEDVLKEGQTEKFRVLEVDEDSRRIKLSLKAVAAPLPEQPAQEQASADRKSRPRKPKGDLKGGLDNEGLSLADLLGKYK
jgi:small subunit ribosomal protein S1